MLDGFLILFLELVQEEEAQVQLPVSICKSKSYFLIEYQSERAGQASRAGTRASRIIRIIRLVRLIRIVKLYKHAQQVIFNSETFAIEGMEDQSKYNGINPDVKLLPELKHDGPLQSKENINGQIQKVSDVNSFNNEGKKEENIIDNEDKNKLSSTKKSSYIDINKQSKNNISQKVNLSKTQTPKNEQNSNKNQSLKKFEVVASKKKGLTESKEKEEVVYFITINLPLLV